MEDKYYLRRNKYYTFVPVLLGTAVGSLLLLVMIGILEMPMSEQGLENYGLGALMNLPQKELIFYILKKRGLQLLVYGLLAWSLTYPVAAFSFNGLFGIFYGMITCDLFIKFGFWGLVYSAVCFFPHYFCYFAAIYLGGYWFGRKPVYPSANTSNIKTLQYFIKIIVIFFLFAFAVIWEIKFQKNFLNYFYQYIV